MLEINKKLKITAVFNNYRCDFLGRKTYFIMDSTITYCKSNSFDRDTTLFIKGIALIFMFIHHLFTFPKWYVDGISYPELAGFASYFCLPFKLCVPIFAFLTGYSYEFVKNKTYKYSIRKIIAFLSMYWIVYIPFYCIALFTGCININVKTFLLELFALKRPVMIFCWYVYFYLVSILLLPITSAVSNNIPLSLLSGIIIPVISCEVLMQFFENKLIREILINIKLWYPCVSAGLIYARFSTIAKTFDIFFKNNIPSKRLHLFLLLNLMIFSFLGRHYSDSFTIASIDFLNYEIPVTITMDIIYVTIFIYAIVNIVDVFRINYIIYLISKIGEMSAFMWFIHCIFFNADKQIFQKFLYWPKIPILVLINSLFICYSLAIIFNNLYKKYIYYKIYHL